MRAYGEAAHEKLAELSDVCKLAPTEAPDSVKADAFIRWIEGMKVQMQIPEYPEMIKKEDIRQIAKWAEKKPIHFIRFLLYGIAASLKALSED